MLAIINNIPIDSTLFRQCLVNNELNMVYLVHRPKSTGSEVHLNIIFEEAHAAGRFFLGYYNALYNGEAIYKYEGKATFLNDLYVRILANSEKETMKKTNPLITLSNKK